MKKNILETFDKAQKPVWYISPDSTKCSKSPNINTYINTASFFSVSEVSALGLILQIWLQTKIKQIINYTLKTHIFMKRSTDTLHSFISIITNFQGLRKTCILVDIFKVLRESIVNWYFNLYPGNP